MKINFFISLIVRIYKLVLYPSLLLIVCIQSIASNNQSLFFSSLGINDGLSSNITSSIELDSHGFIWIGTHDGLCRYDGKRFISFRHNNDSLSIESNLVNALLNDNNTLWVGTWTGLSKLNTKTFDIEQVDIGKDNAVRVLYKGNDSNIWVGTANGLFVFDKGNEPLKCYNTTNSSISHNTIRSLYQTPEGVMWVGTYNKLNKISNDTIVSFDLKGNYMPKLKNNLVLSIEGSIDRSSPYLWVGTETGLCFFNTLTGNYVRYCENNSNLSNDAIKCIYVQGNKLWLGTDFGLNVFDINSNTFSSYFHNPNKSNSLINNVVLDIIEDATGLIWFITSNGISITRAPSNFYSYISVNYKINNILTGNQIKSILVSSDNTIWMATDHGLLSRNKDSQNINCFTTNDPKPNQLLLNNIFALYEDLNGRIWIGTAGGINVLDTKSNKMYSITASVENGLTSNYISKIFQDNDGNMWVSAWEGGLFKLFGDISQPDTLKFSKVLDFGSDKYTFDGSRIWFENNSKIGFINSQTHKYTEIESLYQYTSGKTIECLYVSNDMGLWIGAKNLLIKYNLKNEIIEKIPLIKGVDTHIISIIEDRNNQIWASTNNAIVYLNKKYSLPVFLPTDPSLPIKSFYTNCNSINADGIIMFGGDNGYIQIDPSKFMLPKEDIPVYITHVEINNRPFNRAQELLNEVDIPYPVSFLKSIELKSSDKSVLFEFSSLDYSFPLTNMYAYKLEGYDEEWHYTNGDRNFAVYSNLPANEYMFRVKGTNGYGIWLENEAYLKVVVFPSIWLSKGFIFIYLFIIIAITYIVLKINTFRIKMLNEVRITKLEKEHNETLIKTRQHFFTNISHELKTPLNLILSPINQILKSDLLDSKSAKMLSLAQKNSQRLLWLVNQILDFRKIEVGKISLHLQNIEIVSFCYELYEMYSDYADKYGYNYQFDTDIESYFISADKDKLSIVIFNLLSNAFKFTKENGEIIFSLEIKTIPYEKDEIIISIKNEGEGIKPADKEKIFERFYQSDSNYKGMGSGVGLTIAKEYIELHNGTINVLSTPNETTTFIISFKAESLNVYLVEQPVNEKLNREKFRKHIALTVDPDKYNIIAVDDNPDILSLIEITLNPIYNIQTFIRGGDALQMIKKNQPDLVISDIMMPGMDGITFCQQIRNNTSTNHIPIILLTAKTHDESRLQGVQAGADIYMTKPFDENILLATIERLLARKKELQEYIIRLTFADPRNEPEDVRNNDQVFLKKVMTIVENNLSNDQLSVDFISEEIGISSTHLYRKIKSITNLSTNELIKKYRIKTASIMLKNNEGNVTEIMYSVGFSNLSYFSKCFKSEFGCTPKEFYLKNKK
ncbi:MAG: response regulator [Marinilabiliaceae bacterium]|nr:response regulator [Marinilabiliaceae bacterium]